MRICHGYFPSNRCLDFRAALEPHQHLVGGQHGHALYELPDGSVRPIL